MKKNTPLGDTHNGKQTQLVQAEDTCYIEKPRSFRTEAAFSLFCQRLEELGLPFFTRSPVLLSEGEGFHTQAVEENSPTTDRGIDEYYYRAGILLCVCYLLGSTDLHSENIIAAGDVPVVVDMETLLGGKGRSSTRHYSLKESVMCSHLLCSFFVSEQGAVDVSGLSGTADGGKNIPHTKRGKCYPAQYSHRLISGFCEAYNIISSHKEQVGEALHLFDGCLFRQLLRPTQTYHTLSEKLGCIAQEKRMASAQALLSYAYQRDTDAERLDKAALVLSEEVRSVLDGEIPLFYTKGNGTDLYSAGEKVFTGFLEVSPVSYAVQRLNAFCQTDLKRQTKLIELALHAVTPLEKAEPVAFNRGAAAPGEIIASQVTDSAIFSLPSVFCTLEQSRTAVSFISSGFSLYTGLGGIMCMYAALYRKTGKKEYYDTLLRCFENFTRIILYGSTPVHLTPKNAGLGDGITGMLAALIHIYELTECTEFMQAALTLADRLVFSGQPSDTDYLNGIGALPVVLCKIGTPQARQLAQRLCADIKAAAAFTTGAAHGASGLMLSLCALSELGADVALDDILRLLRWENSHFCPENGNWQDLRNAQQPGFMSGWCSGAPGIGMVRREMLQYIGDERLQALCRRDVERAVEFLGKQTPTKRDSLCCGTAARLMAASRLGVGVDGLYDSLVSAEEKNRLRFVHPADTADVNTSLLQGYAGVGYALAMYGDSLSGGMLL